MVMSRKRPLKDPKQHYAYVWRLDREVIWVGYGKDNRGRPTCKASWSGRPQILLDVLEVRRDDIDWRVFPCDSKEEAIDLERRLIKSLKPKYNTAPHNGGWKGMHSQEGLNRISQSQKGREVSEEVKEGRRLRMLGNKNLLGYSPTDETRKKISSSLKGRQPSTLAKQKASERMAERNVSNPPRKGRKCSAEHRRKLSEAAKRRRK